MFLCLLLVLLLTHQSFSAGSNVASLRSNGTVTSSEEDVYYPFQNWSDIFDWQLLKAFPSPTYKNVIISPISLKLVLALLYEGASGITEKEFQSVLQFPEEKKLVRDNFLQILESLQPSERKEYVLNLGTRIFMDSHIHPQQKFAAKAEHNYQTTVEAVNFGNSTESASAINSWVEMLTNGRIKQLVSPGDLADAIMVITNAIFFKGSWRHQFPKNQTALGGFYVTPSEVVNTPFMTTIDRFFFYESGELDSKIIRLPYKGKRYALFLVLPNSKGGLPELIKKINLQVLKRQLYNMDEASIEVSIPKFKFDFNVRYSNILQDFGLREMFQNTASFPGIARGEKNNLRMLYVSDIIQKAGIQLDEEGSVVYAASDVQLGNKFGEVDNVFNATHPFLFFIEEQTRGTILFVGKVENPLDIDPIPIPSRFGEIASNPSKVPISQAQLLNNAINLQPESSENEALIRRFNYFDLELLEEFSESNENVFISPASIKTTLAMVLEGARGQSALELGNALRIHDIDHVEVRNQLNRLLFNLMEQSPNTKLEAANAVFVSNKIKILSEYRTKLNEFYKASIQNVDFTNAAAAVSTINQWASNTTHGEIQQIVGNDNSFADTSVLIANTLYFKGKWKNAFEEKNTKTKCFYSPTKGCVNVPTMNLYETLNYNLVSDLNAHALEIPYEDDNYSMLILLPASGNNIKVLARDMQHAHFRNILDNLQPTEIKLYVPRFEIEYVADLVDYLRPLKIQDIFKESANLTGMIDKKNVKINNIFHTAKIQVDEKGTKAVAATSAVVIPLIGDSYQQIDIDKPFLFFIYHKKTANIIFEGIFIEPNGEASSQAVLKSRGTFPEQNVPVVPPIPSKAPGSYNSYRG